MKVHSVDVLLCTWNRAALLERTLQSFCQLRIPAGVGWHVIAVDNNSTDRTAAVLNAFGDSLPLRIVTETEQGHTFARNRGISQSSADLVVWTDDDVDVDPGWIEAHVSAANQFPADSFFGGPIAARFLENPPRWINENRQTLSGCFAERDLGSEPVALTAASLPYGANFAVRGDLQRAHTFDTKLGRKGHAVVGEDELEFLRRLLTAGYTGRWVPAARVQHLIPAQRATTDYVRDYFAGQGVMLAQQGRPWTPSRLKLWLAEQWHSACFRLSPPWATSPWRVGHLARWGLARGQRIGLQQSTAPADKC